MKVFLDANVLISVINKEYPLFSYSSRVLSLAGHSRFYLYTSPTCLAIAFYFSEKKSGTVHARQKMILLAERLHFTSIDNETVQQVIKNKKILDLEDGLQYYSARASGCDCIVTEDSSGYHFSEIEVLTSRAFLENYIF